MEEDGERGVAIEGFKGIIMAPEPCVCISIPVNDRRLDMASRKASQDPRARPRRIIDRQPLERRRDPGAQAGDGIVARLVLLQAVAALDPCGLAAGWIRKPLIDRPRDYLDHAPVRQLGQRQDATGDGWPVAAIDPGTVKLDGDASISVQAHDVVGCGVGGHGLISEAARSAHW